MVAKVTTLLMASTVWRRELGLALGLDEPVMTQVDPGPHSMNSSAIFCVDPLRGGGKTCSMLSSGYMTELCSFGTGDVMALLLVLSE